MKTKHTGKTFRAYREKKGISQNAIAHKIGLESGQGVSNFERLGYGWLAPEKVMKYAKIVGINQRVVFESLKSEMLNNWKRRAGI